MVNFSMIIKELFKRNFTGTDWFNILSARIAAS